MKKTMTECRICKNKNLEPILSLGEQCLTSVYPHPDSKDPSVSPLNLMLCNGKDNCNLVQLEHIADIDEMYGTTYGYFSSISPTMVTHLKKKMDEALKYIDPKPGEAILDIGCNDGTFLNFFKDYSLDRNGIDPSSKKFKGMFQDDIKVSYDFFSEKRVRDIIGNKECRLISSIAMFYDIDDPTDFMRQVNSLLQDNGIWLVEIAYLPLMMENLAYDQIMHEHLTYLGLKQMKWMMEKVGLKMLDASLNNMNGGSISLIAGKKNGPHKANLDLINKLQEKEKDLENLETYKRFSNRVRNHKEEVKNFLSLIKSSNKTIYGYGASTKGNVILNYCGLTKEDFPAICDQNPEKPGLVTPGTRIPIISKDEVRKIQPDYLFVFIWHLRKEVIEDEKEFIMNGGTLVFNLPRLHTVNKNNYENYMNSEFKELAYPL